MPDVMAIAAPAIVAPVGGTLALYVAPALAATRPGATLFRCVRRLVRANAVALTFDDGPHPKATVRALEVLADHGARATFFLVGREAARFPGLVADIVAGGHEVGCHGHEHRSHLRRPPRAIAADLRAAQDRIEGAAGVPVRLFRPPYGAFNAVSWMMADRLGWRRVLWSRWARDWEAGVRASTIVARTTRRLRGGEIVLLHDSDRYAAPGCWQATVAALPDILRAARDLGLETVTVSEGLEPA
jgi:peptidoglycan/xylan/chitin deacetylase (PgdA/CDA1 family)